MKSIIMNKTKTQLKDWAVEIRRLKNTRKLDKRENRGLSDIEYDIYKLKRSFRHLHIAYCEIRGRSREQIETPKIDNLPDNKLIDSIKKGIQEKLEQEIINEAALCVNS